jgi:uncharacterized membrane protein YfcA
MAKEAATSLQIIKARPRAKPKRRHNPLIARAADANGASMRRACIFPPRRRCCSASSPGMLTVLLGVGGGFIVVPAMIYLLACRRGRGRHVPAPDPVRHGRDDPHPRHDHQSRSTSCSPLCCCSAASSGRNMARGLAQRTKPELLRMFLAVVVLAVALRMALELGWRPPEIYTVQTL